MRLIDADSLIEEINKVYAAEEKEDLKWAKGLHYAKAIIRDMPTIETDASTILKEQEAVDKNTGEWKNGHCSCCGEDVSSMLDTWTNVQNFLFCPNCGAKMEGR